MHKEHRSLWWWQFPMQDGGGGPTGVVFNGSSDFDVEAGKPAIWFLRQPISAVSAIAFWLASQFGSGQILAFDAITSQFQGQLRNQDNNIISISGLWGLAFGAGNTNSGGANQLFFNAKATGGLHGFFAPVSSDLTQGNDQ